MTLYDLLHKVSAKLSEEHADAVFDYFIHAMDDNGGFLRTRWCRQMGYGYPILVDL